MKRLAILLTAALAISCGRTLRDGEYTLTVLSTNDVHGTWFDSTYTGGARKSLFAVNTYVDSVRRADGAENVLLIDAGDCLQGDNAAYYYNYVDTETEHLFSRLVAYMKYDAVIAGNHDIETGHRVYDRVATELKESGIPFLAGNAVRDDGNGSYFPLYTMVDKAGLRVAVLGYENANIDAWLSQEVWSGMHFELIASRIQADIDLIRKKEIPDVVVAVLHSATGKGDGANRESESMTIFNSVRGIDWLICGHDHIPFVETRDTCGFLNSGSHARFLAHGKMHIKVAKGKVVSKSFETDLIPVKAENGDPVMRAAFQKDFEAVREFTLRPVATLTHDIYTRDSYAGQSLYLNILHNVTLNTPGVEVSIAAPLTFNGSIKKGTLIYNDLFTIYPFENQLYVIGMTGDEIRRYLEASYDRWIQTPGDHVLKIKRGNNPRTGELRWSFDGTFFNFDSAGGINYTVDVTKPYGQRVNISSMADGTPFSMEKTYNVGMTSYRANGGGGLLAAIGIEDANPRIISRHEEIRNLIYNCFTTHKIVDPTSCTGTVGTWRFTPEKAAKKVAADLQLLFPSSN